MTPEYHRLTRIGIILALSAAFIAGIGQAVSSMNPDDNASVAVLFAPIVVLLALAAYSIIQALRRAGDWRGTYRQASRIFQMGAAISALLLTVGVLVAIPQGRALASLLLAVVGLEGVLVLLASARYLRKHLTTN